MPLLLGGHGAVIAKTSEIANKAYRQMKIDYILAEWKKLTDLVKLVAQDKMQTLEVGSRYGNSIIPILPIVKMCGGCATCVDWWKGNIGVDYEESWKDVYDEFMRKTDGFHGCMRIISQPSDIALASLSEEFFDFIYIDGDHRYHQVKKDIERCKQLVKVGGILAGHDCEKTKFEPWMEEHVEEDMVNKVHCGVVKAVHELVPQYSIEGSRWATKRVGPDKWRAV